MNATHTLSTFAAIRIFMWRTWQNTQNNLFTFCMDAILSPVIMLLIFTYLFGGAIAGSTAAYLQFFLPGVLVLTIIPMTVYSGTTICQDIAKGVYNRFRTMPFWQPASVIGPLLTDGLRYTIAILVAFGTGMLLGFRPEGGIVGATLAILFIIFFAFSVSWIFSMIGILAKRPETVSGSSMFFVYPLLFASTIFVDSSTMPKWMGTIVNLNPISIAVGTVRGLMGGTANVSDVMVGIGLCLLLIVIFAPLTMRLYLTKSNR
ncbi:ABC transporter permease [Brevibacillus brevis]|uniref:ABC transporter permease n=1 Tax=Brevibacillus brevis TaxID=1393 RepID=UPI000D0F9049|nr:ABC transporter permease [Brevibacillus brevis]PSJ68735.1 ABC transporter [Brevibacillus brevis]RED33091.1 ABC-2 type transport system permease protein [Brevibacillus brevis]GEC92381.1 transport permease protein [Brevibacillus brevis]VEF90761.1 Daunorubicin/doxorubicin resistance ABC transporter permease protein drrB [Brevibacillus brevis]